MKTLMKPLRQPKGDSDARTYSGLDSGSEWGSSSRSGLDSGNGRP